MGKQETEYYVSQRDEALWAYVAQLRKRGLSVEWREDDALPSGNSKQYWTPPFRAPEPCTCGAKYDRHFPNIHLQYCYFYQGKL